MAYYIRGNSVANATSYTLSEFPETEFYTQEQVNKQSAVNNLYPVDAQQNLFRNKPITFVEVYGYGTGTVKIVKKSNIAGLVGSSSSVYDTVIAEQSIQQGWNTITFDPITVGDNEYLGIYEEKMLFGYYSITGETTLQKFYFYLNNKWTLGSGASSPTFVVGGPGEAVVITTANEINFNLDTLGLSQGTHVLAVKATANGYADSEYSNMVGYTVAEEPVTPTNYTFTLNPTPTSATVTLSATGYSTVSGTGSKSITVANGTKVSWSVSASGYTTRTGDWTISGGNKTENITLTASGGDNPPSGDGITWYTNAVSETKKGTVQLSCGNGFTYLEPTHAKYQGKPINRIRFYPAVAGTYIFAKSNSLSTGATFTNLFTVTSTADDVNKLTTFEFDTITLQANEYFTIQSTRGGDNKSAAFWFGHPTNDTADDVTDLGYLADYAGSSGGLNRTTGWAGFDLGYEA